MPSANLFKNLARRLWSIIVVIWPLLFVTGAIVFLLKSFGSGGRVDASTWPAIRKLAKESVNEPEISAHLRIASYYAVVSFSVGLFLLLNSLMFFVKVRKTNPSSERGKRGDMISGLGVFLRGISLAVIVVWLAALVFADPAEVPKLLDEYLVLVTFTTFAVADVLMLTALLIDNGVGKLLKNRELIGALLYIDVPTTIGVWIITFYAPDLVSSTKAPEMVFQAVAGGAMIVHIVFSQLILSSLIAEEKLSEYLSSRHKGVVKATNGIAQATLAVQSPRAHST